MLQVVGGRHADHYRESRRYLRLEQLDDLYDETDAILKRSAILVGALICGGGQELVQQVAVRSVHFDDLKFMGKSEYVGHLGHLRASSD